MCLIVCDTALFNFNFFTSVSTQCVAPISDMVSLASGLFVPLMGLGFLAINIGMHFVTWKLLRAGQYCRFDICTERPPSSGPITVTAIDAVRDWFVDLRMTDSFWTVY